MSWRDLLGSSDQTITLPWVGGATLHGPRSWWTITYEAMRFLRGHDHGWYTFRIDRRCVTDPQPAEPDPTALHFDAHGYLVGDRLARWDIRPRATEPAAIISYTEPVFLIDPGLDRFVRVSAGRVYERGPLIYRQQEMPVGPEQEVLTAFLDRAENVDAVSGVSPALEAAFRMETHQRAEAERRREELRQEAARLETERQEAERRQQIVQQLGDGAGRRAVARTDFGDAARAALAIVDAELIDHRRGQRGEYVVRYRIENRRFECVCDEQLRIIDSGICLADHATGEKGDTRFTLESLPTVIRQAIRENRLVVYRHV